MSEIHPEIAATSVEIARHFVHARRTGVALAEFPGVIPADLEAAYRCQNAAIGQWPDVIGGWKVGYIGPAQRDASHADRLVGPIFARSILNIASAATIDFPVFTGGFAAVEAEFVFRLGADAPASKTSWTTEQAQALVADMHIGIETAGSPLATINALGPRVVITDFGNNAGLLLGAKISHWQTMPIETMTCTTFIAEAEVGRGGAAAVAGGPLAALAFALSRCARNGRPLRAGCLITTGAITGIHDIVAGQSAYADFGALGGIRCRAIDAREFAQRSATSS